MNLVFGAQMVGHGSFDVAKFLGDSRVKMIAFGSLGPGGFKEP